MDTIWTYVKADRFFPKYAPQVKSYKQKISGKNPRGNPLGFSEADRVAIRKGLEKMYEDQRNMKL